MSEHIIPNKKSVESSQSLTASQKSAYIAIQRIGFDQTLMMTHMFNVAFIQ